MQSAFVETSSRERVGEEVVLLGDALSEDPVASAWNTGPHEALLRLVNAGIREYVG
jgi:alanine racemase